jgi:hypothetical protein
MQRLLFTLMSPEYIRPNSFFLHIYLEYVFSLGQYLIMLLFIALFDDNQEHPPVSSTGQACNNPEQSSVAYLPFTEYDQGDIFNTYRQHNPINSFQISAIFNPY